MRVIDLSWGQNMSALADASSTSAISEEAIQAYLTAWHQRPIFLDHLQQLGGEAQGAAALKGFGYGRPVCISYWCDGDMQQLVLRRVQPNGFGRERPSDRIAEVWRDFHTFNDLPGHVQVADMVALDDNGRLSSLGHATELLLLTHYAPGQPYAEDLYRLLQGAPLRDGDIARAQALAHYLADIHRQKHPDNDERPLLWRRRLRDLIGHGEGIMGLCDSYPLPFPSTSQPIITQERLLALETAANEWRWRLKPLSHRLCQVHGDFHPFNVLFTEGPHFSVIDRSRGEWGMAEDDVSCMVINYLFFGLQQNGRFSHPFTDLYHTFWETYLTHHPDPELFHTIAPWFAWRALVLASPNWYPTISHPIRHHLLTFAQNILAAPTFEYKEVEGYLGIGD